MLWADGTSATRSAAALELALRTSFGVKLLSDSASGSGSDEAVALQAQIDAAIGAGKRLVMQRDKTYVIGTTLNVTASLRVEGNGATIKKTAGLNGYALDVSGADVEVRDLNVDGNRSGGNANANGCVKWRGARGIARSMKATNSAKNGVYVTTAGATLDAYDCEASDHVSGAGAGDGFLVDNSGVLRTHNCRGDNNDRTGFHFLNGSGSGCLLDGTANNNQYSGARIHSANGACGRFLTSNNKLYGLYALGSATAKDWTFYHVEDSDCGRALNSEYTPNPSATGVEILGASGFHFATVVVRRPYGYGVAVGRDTITSVGADHNTFGNVYVEGAGDPAFHISGSSQWMSVRSLVAYQCTMPVSFGEGVPGNANDHNVFEFVHAIKCSYSVINIDAGSNNTFGRVVATDCVTNTGYTSLIRLTGAGTTVTKNTVHCWESENPSTTPPAFIMKCDAAATRNWIASGVVRAVGTATLSEGGSGTNRVDFVTPP